MNSIKAFFYHIISLDFLCLIGGLGLNGLLAFITVSSGLKELGIDEKYQPFVIILVVLIIFLLTMQNICKWWRDLPNYCSDTKAVNQFLRKMIEKQGQTLIFSRDLSWGEDIKDVLLAKAKSKELLLYVKNKTPLTRLLEKAGAAVKIYDGAISSPEIRFTKTNYGSNAEMIAVAHPEEKGESRRIYTYRAGSNPIFNMSKDVITLVDSHLKKSNKKK